MRQSDQIIELFSALSMAQGEIHGAKKDTENTFFKSKYANLASVQDVIREPLSKNGLAIIQLPRIIEGGVEVETILAHKSGQFISETLSCPLMKKDAQAIGLAITYLRRYAVMAMCGVAAEDDDGNSASGRDTHEPTIGSSADKWSGKEGANAREEELQATRHYVTQSKTRILKIDNVAALQAWWKDQKSVMEDVFDGADDPLYVELKEAYASHGKALKAKEAKIETTAEKINDDLPDNLR